MNKRICAKLAVTSFVFMFVSELALAQGLADESASQDLYIAHEGAPITTDEFSPDFPNLEEEIYFGDQSSAPGSTCEAGECSVGICELSPQPEPLGHVQFAQTSGIEVFVSREACEIKDRACPGSKELACGTAEVPVLTLLDDEDVILNLGNLDKAPASVWLIENKSGNKVSAIAQVQKRDDQEPVIFPSDANGNLVPVVIKENDSGAVPFSEDITKWSKFFPGLPKEDDRKFEAIKTERKFKWSVNGVQAGDPDGVTLPVIILVVEAVIV